MALAPARSAVPVDAPKLTGTGDTLKRSAKMSVNRVVVENVLSLFELLAICLGVVALYATSLWLAGRWFRVTRVTWWKALGTVFLLPFVLGLFNSVLALVVPESASLFIALGIWTIDFLFAAFLVRFLWSTSFGKSVLACLTLLGAMAVALMVVLGPVRWFLIESFIVSSNSDAPALVSLHFTARCPHCGGRLMIPAQEQTPPSPREPELGICSRCRQTASAHPIEDGPLPPDRFLVNKLLRPGRWDLVTFRSLNDRKELYVKRVIGLPGEEIVLKEGGVWINGKRLVPPPEIGSLAFTGELPGGYGPGWGSPTQPGRLGPKDYFLIGDFAARSADSRSWRRGVPRSNITGVVSLIYWPMSRWRIFR